ncbi:uncharacterized protein TNCV_2759441 [Trichonephila clavipes]|nr:uncharacterized protein TNCV_2759441 [Trichonephila clavipes]
MKFNSNRANSAIPAKRNYAGQAYVVLSLVKSLDGALIEELDCSKLTGKVPCNNEALQEIDRRRNYRPPSAS